MRKNYFIGQIIVGFLLLTFSSCVNHDFDLDGDNLDTNITVGDSISLPLGNIEKIDVYDHLKKMYDDLKVANDSVLYVEYGGKDSATFDLLTFDVSDIPLWEALPPMEIDFQGLNLIQSSLPATISYNNWSDTLFSKKDTVAIDTIDLPIIEEKPFEIVPEEIRLNSLYINIDFKLHGIEFIPPSGTESDAEIIVSITFPSNFHIEGEDSTITYSRPLGDVANDELSFLHRIQLNALTFESDSDLIYEVTIRKGNADSIRLTDMPSFDLVFEIENPESEIVSYLKCLLTGSQEFSDTIEFGDLQDAFGGENILTFKNPSLTLGLATNLEADLNLDLALYRDNAEQPAMDSSLLFAADGSTSHTITEGLNEIISTPFPERLDYNVNLNFDSTAVTLHQTMEITADYSFKIPFDFDEISLSLSDTITDLFTGDTYDQIFSYIDDIAIEADFENKIGGNGMEMKISAVILDSDNKEISGLLETKSENNKLSIAITNGKSLKEARHLAFTFTLSGQGAIKKGDYIEIKNLRLVSSNGIHYEF